MLAFRKLLTVLPSCVLTLFATPVLPAKAADAKQDHPLGGNTGGTPALSPTGGIQYRAPLDEPRKSEKPVVKKATPGKKAASVDKPTLPSSSRGEFPVKGAYSLGSDDARFNARRPGHSHQGQDITASEGTPVVSPRDGTVTWRRYQADGAGHYLVIEDEDSALNRSYVFMHLQIGSIQVKSGDTVSAGEQIANVGSTGRASGPHLHFEIWEGQWQTPGSFPIDPLPQLKQWER